MWPLFGSCILIMMKHRPTKHKTKPPAWIKIDTLPEKKRSLLGLVITHLEQMKLQQALLTLDSYLWHFQADPFVSFLFYSSLGLCVCVWAHFVVMTHRNISLLFMCQPDVLWREGITGTAVVVAARWITELTIKHCITEWLLLKWHLSGSVPSWLKNIPTTFETNINFPLRFWCTTNWPFVHACAIFSSSHMSLSNRFLYKGQCCSVFHLYNLVDNPNLWPIKFKINSEYDYFPSCEQIKTFLFICEVISDIK